MTQILIPERQIPESSYSYSQVRKKEFNRPSQAFYCPLRPALPHLEEQPFPFVPAPDS
jgi:hypothetical protein